MSLIEEIIFHPSSVGKDKAKSLFPKQDQFTLQTMIIQSSKVNPSSFKILGDMFSLTGQTKQKFEEDDFITYLILRGLLTKENIQQQRGLSWGSQTNRNRCKPKTTKEHENPYKKNSIHQIIQNDDVHFLALCMKEINRQNILSLIEFASVSGSCDCFKFLLLTKKDKKN